MAESDEDQALVEREHILDTLFKIPTQSAPVVFLEGDSGSGTTTLLQQLARRFAADTFGIFLRPSSRFSYGVDYVRQVLAEQFSAHLGLSANLPNVVDEAQFRALLFALRKARERRSTYIVVDGLHQVPEDDDRIVASIFADVLPIGIDSFRFIICGRQEALSRHLRTVTSKGYQIADFALPETARLLAGAIRNDRDVERVHKLCKGLPGRIAVVRRLLDSGSSLESILAAEPSEYLQFIEMEVRSVDALTPAQQLAVAAIAFAKHPVTLETLLAISGIDLDELGIISDLCSFVSMPTNATPAEIQSETHRRWLERRLKDFRDDVHDRYIEHLTANPDTADAIEFLPAYMLAQHKQQALIDAISPNHYEKLFGATRSVGALRARAQLGARAAEELKLARELFQFSLQRSIFSDLYFAEDYQGEVSALIALGRAENALDIASQAATNEARLRMLAAYARGTQETEGNVDPKIREHLRELAESIEAFDNSEVVDGIAEDLAFFDPELAIDLLDKPLTSEDSEYSRNLALARLGISSAVQGSDNKAKILEKTSGRLTDEKLRSIIGLVADIADGAVESVIAVAGPMPIGKRIHFLRSVTATQKGGVAHASLLDYALDQLIESAVYVPKIKDFADLTVGIESATEDLVRLGGMLQRIDAQLGLVDSSGATADYIRVQLNLALAERRLDSSRAANRVLDAYYAIYDIGPVEVRVECAALMLGYLHEIDQDGRLEEEHGLRDVLSAELTNGLTHLLAKTADHFEMVKGAVVAISRFDARSAMEIALRLNTRSSRDAALTLIAKTLVAYERSDRLETTYQEVLAALSCDRLRVQCAAASIKALTGSRDVVGWVSALGQYCSSLRPSGKVGQIAVDLAPHFARAKIEIPGHLIALIRACAECSNDPIRRVELLFALSRCLASTDHAAASSIFDDAVALKKALPISSYGSSTTVRACLSLLLRAFKGLIKFDELTSDHLARFGRLCDVFKSPLVRIAFMSDLAVKAWCAGKLDKCRSIIEDYVQPGLDSIDSGAARKRSNIEAFPAIYLSRGAIAFRMLDDVDVVRRDEVLQDVAHVALRKVSPGDYWVGDEDAVQIGRIEADCVCEILQEIQTDQYFYAVLVSLTQALNSRLSRQKITKQLRADIGSRLLELAEGKLPDKANITHDGYKIVSRARCATLMDVRPAQWRDLVEQAKSIPCLSDSVLIRLEIVQCMPERLGAERKAILNEVRDQINEIPSAYDRFWRINLFAEVAKNVDLASSKSALQDAFRVTFELEDPASGESCRRRVLDIAELIDPKFSDSLVESLDDDPARIAAKAEAEQHAEISRAGRRLASDKTSSEKGDLSNKVLPAAAWKHVGSLVSGKSAPAPPQDLERYIKAASEWDLNDAYPVLSMYLENIGQRLMRATDIAAKLVPVAEAILLSSELAVGLLSRVAIRSQASVFQSIAETGGIVVGRGERAEAFAYLRGWLRNLNPDEHIIVCDPYFSVEDLDVIRLISAEARPSLITVLGSKRKLGGLLQNELDLAWRSESGQDPSPTTIVILGDEIDGESPVHDRWIVTGMTGLKLGTSFNGLGNKLADISVIDDGLRTEVFNALKPFVEQQRLVMGSRVKYSVLTL
ncbi:MAG TPA: ATP-binding protein [Luteimonas sp.]|nr:ATP-binding protein [Luteimonas sp.]